jgi:hypothetical protein
VYNSASITGLLVALGAGLLIGDERERRKGTGPARAAAGIRTFVIATLLGALAVRPRGEILLAVATAGVVALAVTSYAMSSRDDPGLMTANTISKAVVAYTSGGLEYAKRVVPGLVIVIAAAWLGTLAGPLPLLR